MGGEQLTPTQWATQKTLTSWKPLAWISTASMCWSGRSMNRKRMDACASMNAKIIGTARSRMRKDFPCLCLMREFTSKRHNAVQRKTRHRQKGTLGLDCGRALGNRSYLQCVLPSSRLFQPGLCWFYSGHGSAHYTLLLRSP